MLERHIQNYAAKPLSKFQTLTKFQTQHKSRRFFMGSLASSTRHITIISPFKLSQTKPNYYLNLIHEIS